MGKTGENDPTTEEIIESRHLSYLSMIANDRDVRRRLVGPDIGMPPDLLGRLVKFGKLIEVFAEFRESRGTMDFFDIQTPGDFAVVVGQLIEWVRCFEPAATTATESVTTTEKSVTAAEKSVTAAEKSATAAEKSVTATAVSTENLTGEEWFDAVAEL
jgi:hypothetical protein